MPACGVLFHHEDVHLQPRGRSGPRHPLVRPFSHVRPDRNRDEPDVVLASIEAPLTREALNAARLTLEEAGHSFRYGSFQFRPDGALVGVEIVLKVEGQEFHEYVEFVSESCILRLKKTEGPVMEGC